MRGEFDQTPKDWYSPRGPRAPAGRFVILSRGICDEGVGESQTGVAHSFSTVRYSISSFLIFASLLITTDDISLLISK